MKVYGAVPRELVDHCLDATSSFHSMRTGVPKTDAGSPKMHCPISSYSAAQTAYALMGRRSSKKSWAHAVTFQNQFSCSSRTRS